VCNLDQRWWRFVQYGSVAQITILVWSTWKVFHRLSILCTNNSQAR